MADADSVSSTSSSSSEVAPVPKLSASTSERSPHHGGKSSATSIRVRAESHALGIRRKRSKSEMPIQSPGVQERAVDFSSEDITNLQDSVVYWQNEATTWRRAAVEMKSQLDKAIDLLKTAGVEFPGAGGQYSAGLAMGVQVHNSRSPTAIFRPSQDASQTSATSSSSWFSKKKSSKSKTPPENVFLFKKDKKKAKPAHALEELRQVAQFYAPLVRAQTSGEKEKDAKDSKEPKDKDKVSEVSTTDVINHFFRGVPNTDIVREDQKAPLASLSGPDSEKDQLKLYKDAAAGVCVSTYPTLGVGPSGEVSRAGDPNCDAFRLKLWKGRAIACVTDGCGWGGRAMTASQTANQVFMDVVEEHLANIGDLHGAVLVLLKAVQAAHDKIIEGAKHPWEVGATTLAGGVLLPVKHIEEASGGAPYVFVCISVGDCKVYVCDRDDGDDGIAVVGHTASAHAGENSAAKASGDDSDGPAQRVISAPALLTSQLRKRRAIVDITGGNRGGDAKNAGGHIGPKGETFKAQLANLTISVRACNKGDMVLIMSDGIHDNLDPEALGKAPSSFGVNSASWDSVPLAEAVHIKDAYRVTLLQKQIHSNKTPKDLLTSVTQYVQHLTQPSREFMEKTGQEEPQDKVIYPGKMDHSTLLAFIV